MKVKSYQASFVSGELSPQLWGRIDQTLYANAAARLRNVYVSPEGGTPRREGTRLLSRTYQDEKPRLISFAFNTEQAYLHALTPGRITVYRDDTPVAAVTADALSGLTASVLETLNWTQSADTLILVHPDIQPIKITRSSHTVWNVTPLTFTHIPQFDFGSGNEPVMSATRGWPRSIAFKYGRLWLGGLKSRPQTILGSVVGDFFNLDEGTGLDDQAINITIDDDRVNAVMNLFPGRSLHVFTTGGEFVIQGALGDPVTPGKIAQQLVKYTLHGSSVARPVSVDGATVFVENGGNVVRQFVYDDLEQSYNAPNISILSPHLVRNPARMDVRPATTTLPADYMFLVNEDGTMAVLNTLREQKLLGWSLFETQGDYEDVAVVNRVTYAAVRRVINGQTRRFIEKFDPECLTDAAIKAQTDAFVQCLPFVFSPDGATDWDGLGELEGAEVQLIGDGYVLDPAVVAGGAVSLAFPVTELEAGLDFRAEVQTLPAELSFNGQSTMGQFKALVGLKMRLHESRGVVVKQSNGRVYRPAWKRLGLGVLDAPVRLFSGVKALCLGGSDRDVQITITQDAPTEFHLLSLNLEVGV